MAVVPCPHCGEKVSDTRWACPRCDAALTPAVERRPPVGAALGVTRAGPPPLPPISPAPPRPPEGARVVVTGIDVPLGDLAWLFFKWSVAAIPTVVVCVVVAVFVATCTRQMLGGL